MQDLCIEPVKEGKGRTFRASLIGYAVADAIWEFGTGGGDKSVRPIWISFACSEGESRPFTANLRLGRKAMIYNLSGFNNKHTNYVELLKSADYEYTTQRFAEGIVTTAFLPDLFRMDPGMVDPKGIRFVVLPSQEWAASQLVDTKAILTHLHGLGYIDRGLDDRGKKRDQYGKAVWATKAQAVELSKIASLFVAYLDRRSRVPLIQDVRFHVQLLIACLKQGLATMPCESQRSYYRDEDFGVHSKFRFSSVGLDKAGLVQGLAFSANHTELETLLAEEVARFLSAI